MSTVVVILLLSSILLSAVTAVLLVKALHHMLSLTIEKIVVADLQHAWLKYLQIALIVVGMAFGVNSRAIYQSVAQREMQNIGIDMFMIQMWSAVQDTALAIVLAVLILFFIYLIFYYLNSLQGK